MSHPCVEVFKARGWKLGETPGESPQTRTGPHHSEASVQKQPASQVRPEAVQRLESRKGCH